MVGAAAWMTIVVAVAIAGLAFLAGARRSPPRCCSWPRAVAVFHLIVQESYSRYALPIVPAVGYLAVRGLSAAGKLAPTLGSAALVLASLLVTLPAVKAYSTYPSPAYAAVTDLQQLVASTPNSVVGVHQAVRTRPRNEGDRREEFCRLQSCASRPRSRHIGAGAALRRYGICRSRARRPGADRSVEPPCARALRWTFQRENFISGVRPDILDLVSIDSPPAWFAETGWHLTPETLNISEQQGRAEGIAYIRNRPDAVWLVLGGENIAAAGGKPARVSVAIGDRVIDEFEVAAGGRFFKRTLLEPGTLVGEGPFSRLVASYKGADGRPEKVRLTQLMMASPQSCFPCPERRLERDRVQRSDAAPLAMDDGSSGDVRQFGRT